MHECVLSMAKCGKHINYIDHLANIGKDIQYRPT